MAVRHTKVEGPTPSRALLQRDGDALSSTTNGMRGRPSSLLSVLKFSGNLTMAKIDVEYGIGWQEPKDIKGSVTRYGVGEDSRQRALRHIQLGARLPGQMKGQLVHRVIIVSDWKEGDHDGTV
jgi:hypothetical protein